MSQSNSILKWFGIGIALLVSTALAIAMVIGILIEFDFFPSGDVVAAKELSDSVKKELVAKQLIKNTDDLIYLSPDGFFSYSCCGTLFSQEKIIYFYDEEENFENDEVWYKDIAKLDFDLDFNLADSSFVDVYAYDENNEIIFESYISIEEKDRDKFIDEIMKLWQSKRL